MQRAEERAEAGENKIVDLEEELRVIGENLKVSTGIVVTTFLAKAIVVEKRNLR